MTAGQLPSRVNTTGRTLGSNQKCYILNASYDFSTGDLLASHTITIPTLQCWQVHSAVIDNIANRHPGSKNQRRINEVSEIMEATCVEVVDTTVPTWVAGSTNSALTFHLSSTAAACTLHTIWTGGRGRDWHWIEQRRPPLPCHSPHHHCHYELAVFKGRQQ